MLQCVACHCGSVELLVQGKLLDCGHPDPFNVPIYKGRERGESAVLVTPMPDASKREIIEYINLHSRYAVIFSDSGNWTDVANGTWVKNEVELSLLIEHFA